MYWRVTKVNPRYRGKMVYSTDIIDKKLYYSTVVISYNIATDY